MPGTAVSIASIVTAPEDSRLAFRAAAPAMAQARIVTLGRFHPEQWNLPAHKSEKDEQQDWGFVLRFLIAPSLESSESEVQSPSITKYVIPQVTPVGNPFSFRVQGQAQMISWSHNFCNLELCTLSFVFCVCISICLEFFGAELRANAFDRFERGRRNAFECVVEFEFFPFKAVYLMKGQHVDLFHVI
jgi:hypothetical protein